MKDHKAEISQLKERLNNERKKRRDIVYKTMENQIKQLKEEIIYLREFQDQVVDMCEPIIRKRE